MNLNDIAKQASDLLKIPKFYCDLICTGGGGIILFILSHFVEVFKSITRYFQNPTIIQILILIALSFMLGHIVSAIYDSFIYLLNYLWNFNKRSETRVINNYIEASKILASIIVEVTPTKGIQLSEARDLITNNEELTARFTFLEKSYLSLKFISFSIFIFSLHNLDLMPLSISLFAIAFILKLRIMVEEISLGKRIYRDKKASTS